MCALTNLGVTCGRCFVDDFLSRHLLGFHWLFLSQQGLRAVLNPRASPLGGVSVMIFESTVTQFWLTISESSRPVGAGESTCHMWNQFRWWFQIQQWLNFHWLVLSHRGFGRWQIHASPLADVSLMISQLAPTKFSLTFPDSIGAASASKCTLHLCKMFRWAFLSRKRLSFYWLFLRQQGMWALTNPRVTCGCDVVDDFGVDSGLVFIYYFYVNRGCERRWIHASPVEAVWLTISKSVADQFSLTISESTRVGVLTNTRVTCGSGFVDDFWVGSGLVFIDNFWIKRGCVQSQIQTSPLEYVSLMISQSVPT
jgi:hypothetical protein